MMQLIHTFLRDQRGATAIEYSLIAALIAVVIVAAVGAIGISMRGRFNNIANATAQ